MLGVRTAHIHLGPHKTGSTSFQLLMQKKEGFLEGNGVAYVSRHSRCRSAYVGWREGFARVLKKVILSGFDDPELFGLLVGQFEMLRPIFGECSGLIFSDENILGWPVGHFYGPYKGSRRAVSYYPAMKVVLTAFVSAFSKEFDQINFYMVKRDWLGQVKSLYKDFFRKYYHAGCVSQEKYLSYLEQCGAQQSFERFWEEAGSFPGVCVLPYSPSSGRILLEHLGAGLGLPLVQFAGEMTRSNPSVEDRLMEKMIRLHPYLRERKSRYSDKEFDELKNLLS